MKKKGIPERWEPYKALGNPVPGTRFIAFKVPLKESLCFALRRDLWFTPTMLVNHVPDLGLVLDLTNTTRYYDRQEITRLGVRYEKIYCMGHEIPNNDVVARFFCIVDQFLGDQRNSGRLIGVHCTHGVNRTGYLICRYMVEKLGMSAEAAIKSFNYSRGHPIERDNYLKDLTNRKGKNQKARRTLQNGTFGYGAHEAGRSGGDTFANASTSLEPEQASSSQKAQGINRFSHLGSSSVQQKSRRFHRSRKTSWQKERLIEAKPSMSYQREYLSRGMQDTVPQMRSKGRYDAFQQRTGSSKTRQNTF